jgi:hypothetical protein
MNYTQLVTSIAQEIQQHYTADDEQCPHTTSEAQVRECRWCLAETIGHLLWKQFTHPSDGKFELLDYKLVPKVVFKINNPTQVTTCYDCGIEYETNHQAKVCMAQHKLEDNACGL